MTRQTTAESIAIADEMWRGLLEQAKTGNIEIKDRIAILDRYTRYLAVKNKIDPQEDGGEDGFDRIRAALESEARNHTRGNGNGAERDISTHADIRARKIRRRPGKTGFAPAK